MTALRLIYLFWQAAIDELKLEECSKELSKYPSKSDTFYMWRLYPYPAYQGGRRHIYDLSKAKGMEKL